MAGLGSRGWVPRIEYGAGSVVTGTTIQLPSRGHAVTGWGTVAAQGRNDGLLNCVMFNSRRSQNEMV